MSVDAYGEIAAEFARRNAAMPGALAELGTDLLGRLGRRPRLLDLGCGAGRDMAWLEERGASVTGLDVSPAMLAEARRIVAGRLVEADMRELPFPDGSFDGVWCIASLLHVPKREAPAVLAEVRRTLLDGGLLAVSLKRGTTEGWEPGLPGWPERFFARYEPSELARLLDAAGFEAGPVREHEGPRVRWLATIATRGRSSRAATGCP